VIDGGVPRTVSVAPLLVSAPQPFDTMQLKPAPVSSDVVVSRVTELLVAPSIFTEFLRH